MDQNQDREALLREIRKERRKDLEEELAVVVQDAAAYGDELQRDDGAHQARLQKRRRQLEASIIRARELMHDWPITEKDIEDHKTAKALAERWANRQK